MAQIGIIHAKLSVDNIAVDQEGIQVNGKVRNIATWQVL